MTQISERSPSQTSSRQVQPAKSDSSLEQVVTETLLPLQDAAKFELAIRRYFKSPKLCNSIRKVAERAAELHEGQERCDGSKYITHPLAVAGIIAGWLRDDEAVIAALLHDVVEDTPITIEGVTEEFGENVAKIVDGVTKIELLEHASRQERSAENLRKLLLAVAKDWRVILIKLADRIHNMRTLMHLPAVKRKRIAKETQDIYAPLAERLGFRAVRDELQLLSFSHIHPMRYRTLERALKRSKTSQRRMLPQIESKLKQALDSAEIKFTLDSREKNLYSIYRKMLEKRLHFSEIDDIIGLRIVVNSRSDCYQALGIAHQCFRPMPLKVNDYIGMPKNNGYQSLHTTVIDRSGIIVELQIRTKQMHEFAENGLASHWQYKQTNEDQTVRDEMQSQASRMLQGLLELPSNPEGAGDFLNDLRVDLFPNDIYVLTPKGKVIHLPRGATALDLAYDIHTELGNTAESVIVNGKTLPISAKLTSGDMVEIKASPAISPHPQWLNFVITGKARSHIRSGLRESWSKEMETFGFNLLDQALNRTGNQIDKIDEKSWGKFFKHNSNYPDKQALLLEIALGQMDANIVAKELLGPAGAGLRQRHDTHIGISGDRRAGITFAECCLPLPPEPITGIMQKGKGLVVHRKDCKKIIQLGSDRSINLNWDLGSGNTLFRARLLLECTNRKQIFAKVIQVVRNSDTNIANVNLTGGEASNPVVSIELEVEVEDMRHTERLMRKLTAISGVNTAVRSSSVNLN